MVVTSSVTTGPADPASGGGGGGGAAATGQLHRKLDRVVWEIDWVPNQ